MPIDASILDELYVIEWSGQQRRFHIETAAEAMAKNMEAMLKGRSSDWITVGYASTHADAHKLCHDMAARTPGYSQLDLAAGPE